MNSIERLWKLKASVNALVLSGKRNPEIVVDYLQTISFSSVIKACENKKGLEKLWILETSINHLVNIGLYDAEEVSEVYQKIIDEKQRFGIVKDLGAVVVPKDYNHATRLASFKKENEKKFCFYSDEITDQNYSHPTRILKPGDKLRVKIFGQTVFCLTKSQERIAFLDARRAVYTGAQGASLVFEQKANELPKGFEYSSYDKKENLFENSEESHGLPNICAFLDGGFRFERARFEDLRRPIHLFIGFFEEE